MLQDWRGFFNSELLPVILGHFLKLWDSFSQELSSRPLLHSWSESLQNSLSLSRVCKHIRGFSHFWGSSSVKIHNKNLLETYFQKQMSIRLISVRKECNCFTLSPSPFPSLFLPAWQNHICNQSNFPGNSIFLICKFLHTLEKQHNYFVDW